MSVDPVVVEELRQMFRDGATPSRLIQHIVARHSGERDWRFLIQDYFREAFSVPIVRGLKPFDDYSHADLRSSFLNQDLLQDMMANQSTWNPGQGPATPAEAEWVASLPASDPVEHFERAKQIVMPEFANAWPHLDAQARSAVWRLIGGCNNRSELVVILAKLAERLQQKINALESQLEGGKKATQGSGT
jgi:hypothetical protein